MSKLDFRGHQDLVKNKMLEIKGKVQTNTPLSEGERFWLLTLIESAMTQQHNVWFYFSQYIDPEEKRG